MTVSFRVPYCVPFLMLCQCVSFWSAFKCALMLRSLPQCVVGFVFDCVSHEDWVPMACKDAYTLCEVMRACVSGAQWQHSILFLDVLGPAHPDSRCFL